MSDAALLAVAAVFGIALGSIPFAWLLVRWRTGRDVAGAGSGTVGALNASRVSRSRGLGVLVLALDIGKGAGAAWLADRWIPAAHAALVAGVGAVAGHDYNPWLSIARRRVVGGKGFATAAGFFLATLPWCVALWLAVVVPTYVVLRRTVGLRDEAPATFAGTLLLPGLAALVYGATAAVATGAVALLILPKHQADLRSLWRAGRNAP